MRASRIITVGLFGAATLVVALLVKDAHVPSAAVEHSVSASRAEAAPFPSDTFSDGSVPQSQVSERVQAPQASTGDDVASPTTTPGEQSPFPAGYTGVRDAKMAELYEVFVRGLQSRARALEMANGKGEGTVALREQFECYAAYVTLIQQQRLYYYGYQIPRRVPANTADVEYHVTGIDEMRVVFEVTRAEFPDWFELKDRLAQLQGETR